MQGPSEFGIKGDATLIHLDFTKELHKIIVLTFKIGPTYDTMDLKHIL